MAGDVAAGAGGCEADRGGEWLAAATEFNGSTGLTMANRYGYTRLCDRVSSPPPGPD